jgi:hypothetical protein
MNNDIQIQALWEELQFDEKQTKQLKRQVQQVKQKLKMSQDEI